MALDDWRRIGEDHRRAAALAAGLRALPGIAVAEPQSNIIVVDVLDPGLSADTLCQSLAARGVLALPYGAARLRMVTYGGIGDDAIAHVCQEMASCLM